MFPCKEIGCLFVQKIGMFACSEIGRFLAQKFDACWQKSCMLACSESGCLLAQKFDVCFEKKLGVCLLGKWMFTRTKNFQMFALLGKWMFTCKDSVKWDVCLLRNWILDKD